MEIFQIRQTCILWHNNHEMKLTIGYVNMKQKNTNSYIFGLQILSMCRLLINKMMTNIFSFSVVNKNML